MVLTMAASHCPRTSRGRLQSTLAKDHHTNNPHSPPPLSLAELLLPAVLLESLCLEPELKLFMTHLEELHYLMCSNQDNENYKYIVQLCEEE